MHFYVVLNNHKNKKENYHFLSALNPGESLAVIDNLGLCAKTLLIWLKKMKALNIVNSKIDG